MDPTGASAATTTLPVAPNDNDEVCIVSTNWNFATGAGPTAIPGPAPNGGIEVIASAGQQVSNFDGVGASYTAVAGNFTTNTYGTWRLKYHAANKTWFLCG